MKTLVCHHRLKKTTEVAPEQINLDFISFDFLLSYPFPPPPTCTVTLTETAADLYIVFGSGSSVRLGAVTDLVS